MILVFVLTAWHTIAAGEIGRPISSWPTPVLCERARHRTHPHPGEHLQCVPMRLPPSALGKSA